jgi:phosphate-selective porin OprO/OprP
MRSLNRASLAIALLWCLLSATALHGAEPGDLVIQNVHIINPASTAPPDLVNLLIQGGVLELISKDKIRTDGSTTTLDADGGFLLGKLQADAPPKFMILDDDPMADMQVLLDTEQHVVFAIDNGSVLVNKLVDAPPSVPSEDDKKTKWLAYDPPPFALPSSIDSDHWNSWQTKWTNGLFISAVALDRQWIDQDDDSIAQFGDLSSDRERGTIRGWRFGTAGTINFERPWLYNIAGAWNPFDRGFDSTDGPASEFSFFDFSVDIPVGKAMMLRVGKQKEPINMDRSMTMVQLASQERYAAADAMFPTRNVGATLYGTAADQRMSWAAGVFNDWLTQGEDLSESATQLVGRVTWLQYVASDDSEHVHLGLGVRHTNAKQGLAYGSRPETGNMPRFVDTDLFDANSSMLYNWEIGWQRGPMWLMAEYSDNHVDAPASGDPNFTGYHISGTWSLTGEMRGFKRNRGVFDGLPVAQSVNQGGKGAMEIALRFSSIDLTEGLIEGGEMDIATAQFNWWLTKSMALSLNYRRTWTDRFDLEGEMDAFVARVMLILQ